MKYFFSYFVFILALGSLQAQEPESISAKINLLRNDIFVKVDAIVENKGQLYDNKLNYLLLSLKRDSNSKKYTKDDSQGEFEILPNEKKTIASLKLILEKDQTLKIYLFVKNKNKLIAQDSININEVKELLKTSSINEVDIEITGLVVERVKTKIGKDFYDLFYQKYNRNNTKYSFVININEKPFFGGRNSLISIEIGDDKIYEFQPKPDEDLLNKTADYTLKLIENYNKNRNTFETKY